MSVNARVVLLVGDDTTLYTLVTKRTNKKIDSHIAENSTSLSAFGSILKIFEGTVSVNVRVVLLVEDDKTMYIMVTRVSTKR
jgi:hypothetical protein